MRQQIDDQNLDLVCGGKCYMNANTGKLLFTTDNRVFQLNGVSSYQALELMNSFLGQCDNDADFNSKCIDALTERGWVNEIGTY